VIDVERLEQAMRAAARRYATGPGVDWPEEVTPQAEWARVIAREYETLAPQPTQAIPRLPEPDFDLMGYRYGPIPAHIRAEMHDQWHVEHPNDSCDSPEKPRSMHRPGLLERLARDLRYG
jgi:hypothetical protein